jgi:hypothetical protein
MRGRGHGWQLRPRDRREGEVVGNNGSREVVSAGDRNNGSDSAKALGRHRRRSAAATLTEETARNGLGVSSSYKRRGGGGRGAGSPP